MFCIINSIPGGWSKKPRRTLWEFNFLFEKMVDFVRICVREFIWKVIIFKKYIWHHNYYYYYYSSLVWQQTLCEDQNLFVHVEEIKGEVFMRRMSRMSDTNGRKRVKEKVGFKPMFGWFYMVYFWAFQLYQPYMIENWNQQYILIGTSKCLSKVSLLPIFIAMMQLSGMAFILCFWTLILWLN